MLSGQQRRTYRLVAPFNGRFANERRLNGQPGVSTLYAVDQVEDGGTAALQVLRFLADRPATHQRLARAVEAREQLGCDGLVPVIAAGHAPEGSWIALAGEDARTLRQVVSTEGPLSLPRALAILRPVAEALDAGHAVALVSDSLTADTVIVSGTPHVDERGQLTDLGPVWSADVRPGRLLGDPSGLAPEEIRGAPPSPAGNVYALTALLVRCLTGDAPFSAPTRAGVLSGHLSSTPPSVSRRVPDARPALDAVIASGLAKDPRDRPPSACELLDRAALMLEASAVAEEPAVESAAPPPTEVPETEAPATETPAFEVPADALPLAPLPATRWEPSPRTVRAARRVAVAVPAVALTALAVMAALHSHPVQRKPAPPTAATQRTPKNATTATLSPIGYTGRKPAPSGRVEIAEAGERRELTVSAANLPPEGTRPRQAYAVWLYNAPDDAERLGFVVPPVGASGRFESHRVLPAEAGSYHEIVISLEGSAQDVPEGPIVLRGQLPTSALKATGSSAAP
jgi:serine/threonine-protein kinase